VSEITSRVRALNSESSGCRWLLSYLWTLKCYLKVRKRFEFHTLSEFPSEDHSILRNKDLHRAPWYLADYCVPVSEVPSRQHLRSARCHQLSVPRVCRSPCIFCRRTSSLEFTAWSFARSSCWLRTWRRICSPDIRNVGALEVLRNRALQIDICLLTYLFHKVRTSRLWLLWVAMRKKKKKIGSHHVM